MLRQTFAIARNTFVESLRQPIVFVLVMAGGIMQVFNLLLSAYSMGYSEETEVHGDDKMLLDMGLATVLVCTTLLAAFIATSVISREIENRTVLTVISKPVARPLFVLGKYLGVAGAVLIVALILLAFFLFAIKHEVMSTARDHPHGPVILFSTLAVLISIALGIWGNYFYGWVFSSTAVFTMLPLVIIAYIVTLFFNEEWEVVAPGKSFKPQILIASGCVVMAMLVLTAVAVACSARLGQVMTVVVCAGVFFLGLLSNHLFGRHAFHNTIVGRIKAVEVDPYEPPDLTQAGDEVVIEFERTPRFRLDPGKSFYYGPDPSGASLAVPEHQPFAGDPEDSEQIRNPATGPALIVRGRVEESDDRRYRIVNVGGLKVARLPMEGDTVFTGPTRQNWAARAAWSVVPNFQFYWMVDAITQGHEIPPRYLGLVAAYSGVQIVGMLALGTLLFQKRDVG